MHITTDEQVEIAEKLAVVAACLYKLQTSADENERELAMHVAVEAWNHLIRYYQLDEAKLAEAWRKVSDTSYQQEGVV